MLFKDALAQQFSLAEGKSIVGLSLFQIGQWFLDKVKDAIRNVDLNTIPREEFLKLVGEAYDKYVLPLDLPGPDPLLDPLLKQMCLVAAGRLYDKVINPPTG